MVYLASGGKKSDALGLSSSCQGLFDRVCPVSVSASVWGLILISAKQ